MRAPNRSRSSSGGCGACSFGGRPPRGYEPPPRDRECYLTVFDCALEVRRRSLWRDGYRSFDHWCWKVLKLTEREFLACLTW